jgi:CRISPR-associated endonuclease/helicase Cas3
MILLPTGAGGYSTLGWDSSSSIAVSLVPVKALEPPEGTGDDRNSRGPALTIADHTQHVCDQVAELLNKIGGLPAGWPAHLLKAARWHDAGKSHRAFQRGMRTANPALDPTKLWAKSGVNGRLRHGRRYFRHELASALAALRQGLPFEVAYLIAAHHGNIRLSIRSLPDEDQPDDPGVLFALGLHDGDLLPAVDLGGETSPVVSLDLSPMRLGGESSWTALALALRDALGPFLLAYMETLLRAADLRASESERRDWHHA